MDVEEKREKRRSVQLSVVGVAHFVCSLAVSLAYFSVRALTTLNPDCRLWSAIVLAAEVCAALSTLLYLLALLPAAVSPGAITPAPAPAEADAVSPHLQLRILIPCYTESLGLVAATVLAAASARLPPHVTRTVYLCDDGCDGAKKVWVGEAAQASGCALVYVSRSRSPDASRAPGSQPRTNGKSDNLNHALRRFIYTDDLPSSDELVACFDADMVASTHLFERLLPHLSERGAGPALVLCPQRFHNIDAACDVWGHANTAWWDVTVPAVVHGFGGCACCGTGFVVRAAALAAAGWFPDRTLCEDSKLALNLQALGHSAAFVNETLVAGEAPAALADIYQQRYRWARGNLQNALDGSVLWQPGHPLWLRVMSLSGAFHYAASAFYCPVFLMAPPLCLLLDWAPFLLTRPSALLFAAHYALMTAGNHARWTDRDAAQAGWFGTQTTPLFWFMHARALLDIAIQSLSRPNARFAVTPKSAEAAVGVIEVSDSVLSVMQATHARDASEKAAAPRVRSRALLPPPELVMLALLAAGCVATGVFGAVLLDRGGASRWTLVSTLWALHNAVPYLFALGYAALGYGAVLRALTLAGKWLIVACSTLAVTEMVDIAFEASAPAARARSPWFALCCGVYATVYLCATSTRAPSRYRAHWREAPATSPSPRRAARWAAALLALSTCPRAGVAVPVPLYPDAEFWANASGLFAGDTPVSLRGVSWFGFESSTNAPHGLNAASLDSLLDFLALHSFSALRLPFSAQLALSLDTVYPTGISASLNPTLVGSTAGQVFDRVVAAAKSRGILVLPDMHTLTSGGNISSLWYDAATSEATVLRAWTAVVQRYADEPFVFGVDLKNEPSGAATWGGAPSTDWAAAAERMGNALLAINPRLLVFVEGVPETSTYAAWNGGNLEYALARPITLAVAGKVVYSPHVYGPAIYAQPYFSAPSFPTNMAAIWDQQWGRVQRLGAGAVVVGEFGGPAVAGTADAALQSTLVAYLAANNFTSSFYWCLNPDSSDTGGLLAADWATPVMSKLALVAVAVPSPTSFIALPFQPPPSPPPPAPLPPPPLPPAPQASAAGRSGRAAAWPALLLSALLLQS